MIITSLILVAFAQNTTAQTLFDNEEVEVISQSQNPLVQVFDISGIILGSSYQYVIDDVIKESGYKIEKEDTRYPKFLEFNYNYECRAQKQTAPKQLQKCTRDKALQEKQIYTNYMKLKKDLTGETIELYFTSNQTENQVYQIIYKNDANEEEGIGKAYQYQRQEKLRHFLQRVYDKFGMPNVIGPNGTGQIWASDLTNPKKPVMRVYYGKIVIEDLSLYEADETQIKAQAQKTFKSKKYDF